MALSAAEIQARPACPQGHPGRVYRHGRQVRTDGAYSRPRFRCVPSNGQSKHTFTVPRRQPAHGHPHGLICSSCERDYGPGDGPRTPRRYTQTVIEVASLLASIGRGDSLRLASRDARTAAQRMSLGQRQPKGTPRTRLSVPSRQNVLGARYLDVYGRRVADELLPRRWPRLLILDSKPLTIRPYGVIEWDDWDDTMPRGGLLAAAGTDLEQRKAMPWRLGLLPDETHESWLAFLERLDGEPEWIVADRAEAIWKAVEIRWPKAQRFYCAWHLNQNLIKAAYRDGVYFEGSAIEAATADALRTVEAWETLADVAERERAENVLVWMVDNEVIVRRQIELRAQFPDRPRSNGAAERLVAQADERLGKRRRNFRNARRLATVLDLMTLEMRGQADPLTYARLVREAIDAHTPPVLRGDPHMDRGALVNSDAPTGVASIASMLIGHGLLKQQGQRDYWVAAKAQSVQRRADELNAERARRGLPLIEVKTSPSGIPSAVVRGKPLTWFFEFADEWATDKNGRGPAGLAAGSGAKVWWWRCAAGHEWKARISERVIRLVRCQRCVTKRTDEESSLAGVYPELLASWDDERNRPLTPQTIKATYPRRVSWRCLAGLDHPEFSASIAKRRKDEPPCPLCRRMRPAARRKANISRVRD